MRSGKTSIWICLILLIILNSCKTINSNNTSHQVITGYWKEYWTESDGTALEYNDIYKITTGNNGINIVCDNRPNYSYEDIIFKDGVLTFKIINTLDPDDLYIINYILEISKSGTELLGHVITNKRIKANIRLEKIP